jgi:hypothetical protein
MTINLSQIRAKFLLVAGLALFVGACSGTGTGGKAPAPLDKQLLTGKWKNSGHLPFVTGYEFAEDGTLKVAILGMEQPMAGRYAWNGERTLGLEYQAGADVQQAYEAAAKAYKDDVNDRVKAGKMDARISPALLGAVRDKWPNSETVKVGLFDKPATLTLSNEGGASETFEKAD